MKNLLIALLLLPATVFGQSKSIESFINQYQDNDDVSVVSIEGSLFSLIASMADFEDEDIEDAEEMEAVKRIFSNIESMKIVSVPYRVAKFDNTKIKEFRAPESDFPTWGKLLADAVDRMERFPERVMLPGVAISLTVLSVNYLGAPFALRFSLLGNSAYHSLIQVYMFNFHISNFNAPGICLFVQNCLDIRVKLFALC